MASTSQNIAKGLYTKNIHVFAFDLYLLFDVLLVVWTSDIN